MTRTNGRKNQSGLIAKVLNFPKTVIESASRKKRLILSVFAVLLVLAIYRGSRPQKTDLASPKTVTQSINRNFEMSALTNTGKVAASKVRFTLVSGDKTNKVIVQDKSYTAQNDKMFLIINLEIKNDDNIPLNILPGDLIRLRYGSDSDNKYAPDLHNNLVLVAAISTKKDRLGFVVPGKETKFKLYVGELEEKKEEIEVNFPS